MTSNFDIYKSEIVTQFLSPIDQKDKNTSSNVSVTEIGHKESFNDDVTPKVDQGLEFSKK